MDSQDDDAKRIEARVYARGYVAGRRKRKHDNLMQQRARERQAFLDKAFLAALPYCLDAQGWMRGKSIEDRVRFAWRVASAALKER